VLHQIGVGALGPVFRTYEPSRDRLVAVKVFRLDVTPEQAQSLADELGRAATLGLVNPSIVEPVAAGIEGTVAYRAEEYVAAESLDVAMRHYAPATLDKVLPFITQLASAIDSARALGVGHGALHPRDIFVTPEEARATGFGVVDALDRLGIRAPVRRPYSAPERIAGEPWGTAADVFSLAAITFELLTGRRPAGPGDQMGPLTGALIDTNLDALRAVLARGMHEDPRRRFDAATAFASALDQAAGHFDTRSPAPVEAVAVAEPQPTASPQSSPNSGPNADNGTLADFPLEPVSPAPVISLDGESAREVARKVIAAREVRRRHIKPVAPIVPALAEPEPVISLVRPPDADNEDESRDDIKLFEIKKEVKKKDEVAKEDVAKDEIAQDEIADTVPAPVVAVDEFRVPETEPVATLRSEDRATLDRLMAPKPSIEPFDPELPPPIPLRPMPPPPRIEEPPPPPVAPNRQRIVMLPLAIILIVGLLVGYMAGYLVGTRDTAVPPSQVTAANTPPSPTLQTPGTSGQAPAQAPATKEFSEQAVAPSSASGASSAAQPTVRTPPPVPSETVPAPLDSARGKPVDSARGKPVDSARGRSTSTPKSAVTSAPTAARASGEPRKPATARVGHIVVTSEPSHASVTVNGKWTGRTPLTLADLPFGKYLIRVVEPGYEIAREEVSLTEGSPRKTVSATLRPVAGTKREPAPAATTGSSSAKAAAPRPNSAKTATAATGEIFVDSRPRGARVLIDGKEYGVTPTRVPAQTVGQHVVRLELADHAPWTKTESVIAGTTARVTGSLERIR
jgi:serine/threonine protein kinase